MSGWATQFPQWQYGYTQLPNYTHFGAPDESFYTPSPPRAGFRGGRRGMGSRRGGGFKRGAPQIKNFVSCEALKPLQAATNTGTAPSNTGTAPSNTGTAPSSTLIQVAAAVALDPYCL